MSQIPKQDITLFKSPLVTTEYFFKYVNSRILNFLSVIRKNSLYLFYISLFFFLSILYLIAHFVDGPHDQWQKTLDDTMKIAGWWVGLGILSSVGLGTGLHTFVLYLGPFIATVAMTATECNTLRFNKYEHPTFVCPEDNADTGTEGLTFVGIFRYVQLEAILWGIGTALGELPPYLIARAASQSGENLEELEGLLPTHDREHSSSKQNLLSSSTEENSPDEKESLRLSAPPLSLSASPDDHDGSSESTLSSPLSPPRSSFSSSSPPSLSSSMEKSSLSSFDRMALQLKKIAFRLLGRYRFIGILLFASIPNPLFDLAGLICGHFRVPFWSFFIPTAIGKGLIKAQGQAAFVVAMFRKEQLDGMVSWLERTFSFLEGKISSILEKERAKFHNPDPSHVPETSWLKRSWDLILLLMIGFFVISIINSLAQSYADDLEKKKSEKANKSK